jgi:CobQ-like glutamine amidotransferase family enzyme
MNLYGDRGNLICIQKRLQWYGHDCIIEPINLHESLDYSAYDMLFMGGGSAQEQRLVSKDWLRQADDLWAELEKGLPALCICGAKMKTWCPRRTSSSLKVMMEVTTPLV